jgi:hypothetical protein
MVIVVYHIAQIEYTKMNGKGWGTGSVPAESPIETENTGHTQKQESMYICLVKKCRGMA